MKPTSPRTNTHQWHSLEPEIALLDARLTELLGGAIPAATWEEVDELLSLWRKQSRAGKEARARQTIDKIQRLFADQTRQAAMWEEAYRLIELRARLVETACKAKANLRKGGTR